MVLVVLLSTGAARINKTYTFFAAVLIGQVVAQKNNKVKITVEIIVWVKITTFLRSGEVRRDT